MPKKILYYLSEYGILIKENEKSSLVSTSKCWESFAYVYPEVNYFWEKTSTKRCPADQSKGYSLLWEFLKTIFNKKESKHTIHSTLGGKKS